MCRLKLKSWMMSHGLHLDFFRTQIKSISALDSIFQNYQNFVKQVSPEGMCSIKLTDWTVSSVAAALPSEVSLHVPPGCLLEFYKHNSLLTPFIWTVRATCQSDELDPFFCSAGHCVMLTSHCRKAKEPVLFRCSGP